MNIEEKSSENSLNKKQQEEQEEGERRKMVAIALYRGNLHRVPNTPRRWPPPPRTLSAAQFKALLRRRSHALSRLSASASPPPSHERQEEKEDEKEREEKPVPVLKEQQQQEQEEEGELADSDSALPLHTLEDNPSELNLPVKQEEVLGFSLSQHSLHLVTFCHLSLYGSVPIFGLASFKLSGGMLMQINLKSTSITVISIFLFFRPVETFSVLLLDNSYGCLGVLFISRKMCRHSRLLLLLQRQD